MTSGFTIGEASMYVMPHDSGTPFLRRRRTIGTIPQSQTGKITPSSPLTKMAGKRLFGTSAVITRAGTNAPITPEMSEPRRINGTPSNTSARNENQKFCQLNANQFISGHRDLALQLSCRGFVLVPKKV